MSRRRLLLLWSGLPVLFVLCVSAKLLSLGVLAGQAATGFEARDPGVVGSAAAGLRAANVIEPHKAPFAEGDAFVLAGDFEAARQRFEEALALTGPDDGCIIRVNLVLSIERLGDARLASKDPTAAGRLFAEGLAIVDGAPEGCMAASNQSAAPDAGEKLEQAQARLRQKSEDAKAGDGAVQQPGDRNGEAPSEADPGRQTQLEELEDSARNSQLERNNGQERGEYLRDGDYGAGPDKPW
ncbi:MAG TPA: hypothetical protein VJ617_02640 [Arthrobacter sp.]|nr:hypothetical protein [Arthrobacter sp.]